MTKAQQKRLVNSRTLLTRPRTGYTWVDGYAAPVSTRRASSRARRRHRRGSHPGQRIPSPSVAPGSRSGMDGWLAAWRRPTEGADRRAGRAVGRL
jgi:hypothetical protein